VLAQPTAQLGFDPSIFISPAKLHLTLLMLKLYSDDARQAAAAVLQGLKPQVCVEVCAAVCRCVRVGVRGDDGSSVRALHAAR
jgi:hypothetical protein